MNVSLPASLRKWIDARVRRDGFGTASEFVRHLVREEKRRERALIDHIDDLIDEGLKSGDPRSGTPELWEEMRREAHRTTDRKKASRRKSA